MNKGTEKESQKTQTKNPEKPAKDKMIKIKESEHVKLIEEAAKYKDQYVRLYAEFDNARKRMDREKQEFIKFANEGLIMEFLGILDNLERSVEAAKAKHQDYTAFLKKSGSPWLYFVENFQNPLKALVDELNAKYKIGV